MLLSMDIIHFSLKDIVTHRNILSDSNTDIYYYQLYDSSLETLQSNYLYICNYDDLPTPNDLDARLNIICCGEPTDFTLEIYSHINILVTQNLGYKKLVNLILNTFEKYQSYDVQFEKMMSREASLQNFIDLATDVIEMPLCMIDMNHNTLAISSKLDSPEDPLWDAMKQGYGYNHYEVVRQSEPKIHEMQSPYTSTVEMISNISGHYIRVSTLFSGHRAIGTIGIHKTGDFALPFEKHTIQLFHFIVKKLQKRLNLLSEIKESRGKFYEQFILDIIAGKVVESYDIDKGLSKLGIKRNNYYQMGYISFKKDTIRTDYHFAMMDYLEIILPNSKCVMTNSNILVLFSMERCLSLSEPLNSKLENFLDTNECICIISPVFNSLENLSKILQLINEALPYVKFNGKDQKNIYYFHDYTAEYCIQHALNNNRFATSYHPQLQLLIEYDQANDTDYFETLKLYLRSNCNTTLVSKLLYIHRNSLQYRMNRIEDILKGDLADWRYRRNLLVSYEIYDYIMNSKNIEGK